MRTYVHSKRRENDNFVNAERSIAKLGASLSFCIDKNALAMIFKDVPLV